MVCLPKHEWMQYHYFQTAQGYGLWQEELEDPGISPLIFFHRTTINLFFIKSYSCFYTILQGIWEFLKPDLHSLPIPPRLELVVTMGGTFRSWCYWFLRFRGWSYRPGSSGSGVGVISRFIQMKSSKVPHSRCT